MDIGRSVRKIVPLVRVHPIITNVATRQETMKKFVYSSSAVRTTDMNGAHYNGTKLLVNSPCATKK